MTHYCCIDQRFLLFVVSMGLIEYLLESMGLQLDRLVAAMRDDADVREKMLAATTSQEIQQVAHSLGQLLGETIEVTPIQLREAIRGD